MTAKVKEWILYAAWLCLYILCVGLGTVEEAEGIAKVFFVLTALIFFIPGIILLVLGKKQQNKKMVLRVRLLMLRGPESSPAAEYRDACPWIAVRAINSINQFKD